MNVEISLVYGLLVTTLVLLVGGWVRMDLIALGVVAILGLSGILAPAEVLGGFGNPAVVTIWAMFILSDGLTRSGVADVIGRGLIRVSGRSEARVILLLMLTAGLLSGFMNNVGVVALMLPPTVALARRVGLAPARLLMPLAIATLLGGMTTLIGTAPNLLVSEALLGAGVEPFALLDFTPIGVTLLITGVLFVVFAGRFLLPRGASRDAERGEAGLRAQYSLQERIFALRVPAGSILAGRRLGVSGLGPAGLMVIALERRGESLALPPRGTLLQGGDLLLVQGRLDRFTALAKWSDLVIERESPVLKELLAERARLRVLRVAPEATLVGQRLRHGEFFERYRARRLAVRRDGQVRRTRLERMALQAGDEILVQGPAEALSALGKQPEFEQQEEVESDDLDEAWNLRERLFVVRVPADSVLAGATMDESRLGEVFDFRLVAVFRGGELLEVSGPKERIQGGDLLLIQGRAEDLEVLSGLQQLEVERDASHYLGVFDRGDLEMVEATLHPRSTLVGKRLGDLEWRERRQVEVAALWRGGEPHRTDLEEMLLREGDALLFVGPRRKLAALGKESDLIVLDPVSVPAVDTSRMPFAGGLMLAVVVAAISGLAPISLAAVAGAVLMVLTRCLSMDQAYRAIDWRVIFLIAGMLPLGAAMQRSGAAEHVAGMITGVLQVHGPWAVIAGLYLLTVAGTTVVPAAAMAVLMAPIALSTSAQLGVLPQPAMMAVAIACTASFMSPVSQPTNVLVMGPGGYRFADYMRIGLPLTAIVFVVGALVLPRLWPLTT
jgi:di/tricarboxylate transporter